MSLEQAMTDLAAAIREQTAALQQATGGTVAAPAKAAPAKAAPAATTEKKTATAGKAAPAKAAASDEVIPYSEVQKRIVELADLTDRATAVGYLKPFGASKGQELKAEDYAEVIKIYDKAIAEAKGEEAPAEDDFA